MRAPTRLTPVHTESTTTRPQALAWEFGCLISGSAVLGSFLFFELIAANAVTALGLPGWASPVILLVMVGGLTAVMWAAATAMTRAGVIGMPHALHTPTLSVEAPQAEYAQFAARDVTVEAITVDVLGAQGALIGRLAFEGQPLHGGETLIQAFTLPDAGITRVRVRVVEPRGETAYLFDLSDEFDERLAKTD